MPSYQYLITKDNVAVTMDGSKVFHFLVGDPTGTVIVSVWDEVASLLVKFPHYEGW